MWCYNCWGDGCYCCPGDGSNTESRWKELPNDLLLKIQENFNIAEKTRVRYACKSWQSLMPEEDISQPFPFLFLPPELDSERSRFYDTVGNKFYKLNKLDLTGDRQFDFRGSSYGWLVALTESSPKIDLINPITGLKEEKLPNLTWEGVEVTDKYILSSNPSLSDNYFVVAIYGGSSSLAYTRCGDRTWTTIKSFKRFIDIVFYEEKLYGLTKNLELMLIEISSSGSKVTQIGPPLDSVPRLSCNNFLVGSSIGLLRIVQRTANQVEEAQDHRRSMRKYSIEFHVYKFDFELGRWSESLADIGENVLFVGRICSMSVPSRDFPKGCSNSIYFMDNCVLPKPLTPRGCLHVGVFDLKTRIVEHSVATLRFGLQIVWPYSIWVTPRFRQLLI